MSIPRQGSAPEGEPERFEFEGQLHEYWTHTQVRDWLLMLPGLSRTALHLYLLIRSMVYESMRRTGGGLRDMSVDQLCWLLPGVNGKPPSETMIKDALRQLAELKLVENPDGHRVIKSTGRGGLQNTFRRYRVNDVPPDLFTGWRNVWDKLDAYRPDWRTNPAQPPTHTRTSEGVIRTAQPVVFNPGSKTAGQMQDGDKPAGQIEGRKSDDTGRISDESGRKSGSAPHVTCENASPTEGFLTSSSQNYMGGDGRRPSAGGLARAGARDAAGPDSGQAEGGSAAVTKKPKPRKPIHTSRRQPVAGEADVYAALDAMSITKGATANVPTLSKAVREFLGHQGPEARQTAFTMYPRSVSQAVARLNAGWHGAKGPERSHPDYRGCSRCTKSGCKAPRTDCDRILRPVGYLVTVLTAQDCEHPNCERGWFVDTGEDCTTCDYRGAERERERVSERLAAEYEADMAEQRQRHEADQAAVAATEQPVTLEAAAAAEEKRSRARLSAAFTGSMLDLKVRKHMEKWGKSSIAAALARSAPPSEADRAASALRAMAAALPRGAWTDTADRLPVGGYSDDPPF